MCSDSAQVAANDLALQNSQDAANKLLQSTYTEAFGQQEGVLGPLQAKLTYMAANPMGYSAADLAAQRASINTNTANAAKAAIGAGAAAGARGGASDIGGGPVAGAVGNALTSVANEKTNLLQSQAVSEDALKQQNLKYALGGLADVGAAYGGASSTALSGAEASANSSINAGSGAISAANTGFEDFAGALSGLSGLAQAGASAYKTFKK